MRLECARNSDWLLRAARERSFKRGINAGAMHVTSHFATAVVFHSGSIRRLFKRPGHTKRLGKVKTRWTCRVCGLQQWCGMWT